MALNTCRHCGRRISPGATTCPSCGAVQSHSGVTRNVIIAVAVLVVVAVIITVAMH